jgi:hypothetical protein
MSRWVCPECEREFGRQRQSHVCVPGCTTDQTFEGKPPEFREIYQALVDYVETLGPVHLDVVRVGVFLKRDRSFAEIRPKVRSLSLSFVLPRRIEHPRIARSIGVSGGKTWYVVKLTELAQVDDQLLDWLTESYDAAGA